MGIWEFINSTAETVKQKAPDLTPVKDACRTSYDYGLGAVANIDNTVRTNGLQRLNQCMPDEKSRAQITLFASKIAQNAAGYAIKEGYKLVPGGKAVAEIVSKTIDDVKAEDHSNQEMKAMKEIISASGKNSRCRNLLDRVEMQSKGMQFGCEKGLSANSTANERLEDLLTNFISSMI